jgi:hypothetical protein
LRVTPEPIWLDMLVLVAVAVLASVLTLGRLSKAGVR